MPQSHREVLFVVNKKLPPADYRVEYAHRSRRWNVKLAMPEPTETVSPAQFKRMDFREGICLSDIRSFWELFWYLRRNRHRIGLVHFFSSKLYLLGPVLAKLAGVRSLATVTGLPRVFNDERLSSRAVCLVCKWLMRLSAACASEFLFQNLGDLRDARKWCAAGGERFRHIGSAPVANSFSADKRRRGPLRILMVARLLPTKGIGDFLRIAEELPGDQFHFTLVGPASVGHKTFLDRVMDSARRGTIDYRGELHGADLHAAYAKAHVFLFTSYGEGLARAMLEAGLAGLCPVAYDINANRDLVKAGCGFVVPLRKPEAAVDVLRRLGSNRALLKSCAENYRKYIEKEYSFERYCERLDDVIESILPNDEVGEGRLVQSDCTPPASYLRASKGDCP